MKRLIKYLMSLIPSYPPLYFTKENNPYTKMREADDRRIEKEKLTLEILHKFRRTGKVNLTIVASDSTKKSSFNNWYDEPSGIDI